MTKKEEILRYFLSTLVAMKEKFIDKPNSNDKVDNIVILLKLLKLVGQYIQDIDIDLFDDNGETIEHLRKISWNYFHETSDTCFGTRDNRKYGKVNQQNFYMIRDRLYDTFKTDHVFNIEQNTIDDLIKIETTELFKEKLTKEEEKL